MMVTGRTFDFDEAKTAGILADVWEADSRDAFLDKVLEYARRFTPPNMATKAVGNIKRAVQTGGELPFQDALAVERELQQLLFQSSDAKEGLAAYIEKRKAQFKGR
jgi:enoyl-CoA hydratase/carnithine racemase